jgi:hypothetical protein
MPLLNCTTTIPAHKTVAEIQQMLAKAGANAILSEYDDQGYIVALIFKMRIDGNDLGFRLPTDWRPVQNVLTEQRRRNSHIKTDQQQAVNVAWRVTKDWVDAQLAIIQSRMIRPHQVFLPYMEAYSGRCYQSCETLTELQRSVVDQERSISLMVTGNGDKLFKKLEEGGSSWIQGDD